MENIWAFLEQTLAATLTAAVLLIAKRLFLDKLSPRWQYGVWAILALRILLPAGLLGGALLPEGRLVLETAKLAAESRPTSALTDPHGVTEVVAPVPLLRPVEPVSVTDWLFYLYAAGIAVCLLWFLGSYLALRRRVARGRAPDRAVLARLEGVAGQYGLKVPRRVVVLPGAESAFVCGPLRPVLVLPERAVDDKVLLHELLHLNCGDLWAGVGMCVLRCLHWCNPLLWYCWDQAQNDCEALCDQRVLERLEGEERREYGVILLSMADDKYARAPGTTSMANGGKNIKARIGAIARFKRYPQGVALGSWCVAVVLAVTCLVGTGGAVEMPQYDQRGRFALTAALINRPTTVAGALDTYAKSVLCDSPIYFAMVVPEKGRSQVWQAAREPFEEEELDDSPFSDLGYVWSRPAWQSEWSVMNLWPDGAGGYTGTLFFTPMDGDETKGIVVQQVAVRPSGDYWTVEPLGEQQVWAIQAEEDPRYLPAYHVLKELWLCPSLDTPYTTYQVREAGLDIRIDLQCRLWAERQYRENVEPFQMFGSGKIDPTPQPRAKFTGMRDGYGCRVSPATEEILLRCAPMERGQDPAVALEEASYWVEITQGSLEEDIVLTCAGSYEGEDLGLQAMPEALAVRFTYDGQEHTCVALPEEVVP